MKNFLIETAIITRDVAAGTLLIGSIIGVIGLWIILDVRL